MRRQAGAETIKIDTRGEFARYTLPAPAVIDFAAVEEAVHDSGYTLKALTLEIEGRVVRERCETCAREVPMLEIPETGQRFELAGTVSPGNRVHLRATASGWAGDHPLLTVVQ